MNMLDLVKATIAFGVYSFPVVGQVLVIGMLCLLWLSYAHRTFANFRRR